MEPKNCLATGVYVAREAREHRMRVTPLVTLACLMVAGCHALGPASVGTGRAAYNDVLARTNSEQTLGFIVRIRYADPIGLLSVSSITANMRFRAEVNGEVGVGSSSNYSGNLVPLSAGIAYEDSPTISYVPVAGQAFLTEWFKPLALDTVILWAATTGRGAEVFSLTVAGLNRLRSGDGAHAAERAAFARAMALLDELQAVGVADWVAPLVPQGSYELVISGYAPSHTAKVEELLALLGTSASTRSGAEIRIAASLRSQSGNDGGLAFQTRSVGAILRGAALGVEVPQEHVTAGVVAPSSTDEAGELLRIRTSHDAPAHASVAVQYRGWWYYVDDTDLESKQAFQRIQLLFLSAITEASGGKQVGPTLTIPVR